VVQDVDRVREQFDQLGVYPDPAECLSDHRIGDNYGKQYLAFPWFYKGE
jgi:hypothetical protein